MTIETLTREQAIKRIRDIQIGEQTDHLKNNGEGWPDSYAGAVAELMAIFDIKEEEL
ncbi:MAG: hypothetical protein ACN2B6_01335 [Rickettsiales bacterium]